MWLVGVYGVLRNWAGDGKGWGATFVGRRAPAVPTREYRKGTPFGNPPHITTIALLQAFIPFDIFLFMLLNHPQ